MTDDAAMPASPRLRYYWGESGQYGPFDVQIEGEWAGWPDCGQVLRYFRKQAGLTAKAFGVRYGAAINADGSPVSERWILDMKLAFVEFFLDRIHQYHQ
ncbi:MAG: hypothetical protein IMW89_21155 [Ktedonobacteraceae bacterium]|nr:hypothetical protein [Ktedonobacteraceae bacterium]